MCGRRCRWRNAAAAAGYSSRSTLTEPTLHTGTCLCGTIHYEIDGPIGTLNTPLPQAPAAHIFVGSKAEWFGIHDGLPQHAERPLSP